MTLGVYEFFQKIYTIQFKILGAFKLRTHK